MDFYSHPVQIKKKIGRVVSHGQLGRYGIIIDLSGEVMNYCVIIAIPDS